jgi:two-component system chemotaxis response regulator CheY
MKTCRILVVDDSLITVRKISQALQDLGYEIAGTALNGEDALSKYQELSPDLVTMDITLPGMNGIETVKSIMEIDPTALIIMITSHGQEQMVIDSIDAGAKGYVMKPVKTEILKETVEKVLSNYSVNPGSDSGRGGDRD